jgi:hypothetical protein
MMRTERFRSLAEVAAHKAQLRAELDVKRARLNGHLNMAREPEFRKALTGNVVNDLINSWQPLRTAQEMLNRSPGMVGSAVDMMLGAKRYTPMGRLFATLASAAVPIVMKKFGSNGHQDIGGLRQELGTSWHRLKEYVRQRRAAHKDGSPDRGTDLSA